MSSYKIRHLATCAAYATGSRIERSLSLLMRLNEARRIGQLDAAAELGFELELHDRKTGYRRAASHAKAFAAVVKVPGKGGAR